MIVTISGKLTKKEPNGLIIDVNGLGYFCHISTNTYDSLPNPGEGISLITYHHITESSQELFAFSSESERVMFKMLIGVSGIGPKTAIVLLSAVTPEEFKRRLIASEVGMLTALPGIGPKTARRIIVELKDKFVKFGEEELPIEGDEGMTASANEATNALSTLGFKPMDIRKVLNEILKEESNLTVEQLIKKGLELLR
ncbi:MAG: Holliday junction branch migration protein RuvA [Candidatus Marinimicrobia bacterium]|nr:Holliday junction branch migration protein RuvA [Candidatus Neomarinimicrobiota bacterium]